MQEKELLKKSGFWAIIILSTVSIFWFLFSIQISFGYSGTGTTQDLKSGSRFNGDLLAQPLSGSVTIYFGTQSTQGTGTTGYIGTNTAGLPKMKYSYIGGSSTFDFIGFNYVAVDGTTIPSAGSLSAKLDAVGGVGTSNTFNNPTLAGLGTITASFGANGLVISPTEYSYIDGASSNIQTQIDTVNSSKLSKVNGVTTYIGSITAAGKTGTGSFSIADGTNITTTSTLSADGSLAVTINSTGTLTTFFPSVTGSITAKQLPSNLECLGILTIQGTTTVISDASVNSGRWINEISTIIGTQTANDANTTLLLMYESPGTTTVTDSSSNAFVVTPNGDYIGTTTARFGTGGGYFSGTGSVSLADNDSWYFTGNFTLDFWVKHSTIGTMQTYLSQNNDPSGYWDLKLDSSNKITYVAKNVSDISVASYISTNVVITNADVWYHVAFVRSGNTAYLFVNGVSKPLSINTAFSADLTNITANLNIGKAISTQYLTGVLDNLRISKGTARWTANFTPPQDNYIQYNLQYISPGTTTPKLLLIGGGTGTTEHYMLNNVPTTLFGLGTTTAVIGTTTAYSGWFDGAVRATAFNVSSTEKIKENIKAIKIKPEFIDATIQAKQKYVTDNKNAWTAINQASYESVIEATGTNTISQMESDYSNYIELQWASDLEQNTLVENVQEEYEDVFWQKFNAMQPKSWNPKDKPTLTRKGFIVEEAPDEIKGDDKQSIDPMALIAYMTKILQSMKAELGSATAEIAQLKAIINP